MTRLELAELLLQAAGNGQQATGGESVGARFIAPVRSDAQRNEALQHLDFAVGEFEEMGMQPALTRARALQSSIDRAQSFGPAVAYPDGLTPREVEVLRLVAAGMSNLEIATALVISVNTVFQHVRSILTKTGAANRTRAAAYALRHGLVE